MLKRKQRVAVTTLSQQTLVSNALTLIITTNVIDSVVWQDNDIISPLAK